MYLKGVLPGVLGRGGAGAAGGHVQHGVGETVPRAPELVQDPRPQQEVGGAPGREQLRRPEVEGTLHGGAKPPSTLRPTVPVHQPTSKNGVGNLNTSRGGGVRDEAKGGVGGGG